MGGCVAITCLFVGWSECNEVQQTRVNAGAAVGLRCAHSTYKRLLSLSFSYPQRVLKQVLRLLTLFREQKGHSDKSLLFCG